MRPFVLLATRADDTVADEEYAQFLRYGGLEESELLRCRVEAAPLPELDPADYSGFITGGSPFTSSDPVAEKPATQLRAEADIADLLTRLVADDVPFLGACYGVGSLGTHQGAVVDRTYGEGVGAVGITLTDAAADDPLCAGLPETFRAFVGHKEAIRVLPAHATLLATGASCPVQMFRIKRNLYATQFHPELDVPGLISRIHTYRLAGYFPPEETEELIARAEAEDIIHPSTVLRNFVERYAR